MGEWKNCTIADIGTVVGGATPSTKNPANYVDGTIPWITPKDLSSFHGRYISHGERNITKTGLNSCAAKLLPVNTVLFSSRAPIGYIAIAKNEVSTNQGFKSVIPNNDTDPLFLYYLLKYNKDKIESMGSGTTFKEVSGSTMKSIQVSVPIDIKEQEKIGTILGLLDDKIEENERINQNLCEQAQTIFDFYYAKAIEKEPYTEQIQVLGGGTPKTDNPDFWNGNIPFFSPKDVGSPYTFQTEKYITESGLAHCNSKLYPLNTCFVTARGTVGKVSLAGAPMAMNQSCYALVGKNIDPLMVYFYTLKVISSLKNKASGAVFDAITTRDFETEYISFINATDSDQVLKFAKPMMDNVRLNSEQNIHLEMLRDTLLPKLMSGELDVSNIDI